MKPCSSLIAVLPLLCAMASCTEVDLCQAEHPHRSFMDFRFHWKEEYQGNRPDSMGVIAVRPVNILRYELCAVKNQVFLAIHCTKILKYLLTSKFYVQKGTMAINRL